MLVVYVLECIYQFSEMGPPTCDRLAAVPRMIGKE
jgi:hypothetical protein